MWLVALLLGLPLIEISLFVTLGAWLGLWLTLAIVLGTAIAGVAVIRRQGERAQEDLRRVLQSRRSTPDGLAGGVLVVLAGILLILPGFFTDACGLLLLLPPVRRGIVQALARRAREGMAMQVDAGTWVIRPGGGTARPRPDEVIDTTWEELPDGEGRPPSGWTRH